MKKKILGAVAVVAIAAMAALNLNVNANTNEFSTLTMENIVLWPMGKVELLAEVPRRMVHVSLQIR